MTPFIHVRTSRILNTELDPVFNGLDEYDLLLDFRRNGPLTLGYTLTKARTYEPHARSLH